MKIRMVMMCVCVVLVVPSAIGVADDTVRVPAKYLTVRRALETASRQCGISYVILVPSFKGVVGPYSVGERRRLRDVLRDVARASGTVLERKGEVWVFQLPSGWNGGGALRRCRKAISSGSAVSAHCKRLSLFDAGKSYNLGAIPLLVSALSDKDASVRHVALLSLAGFEGDFLHNRWPGRLSVFELEGVTVDEETLLWLVDEGSPPGSSEWRAAVSILARSHCVGLPRILWRHVWVKTPLTVRDAVWALGMCRNKDMEWVLGKRIRRMFTNKPEDRFVAAAAAGRLGLLGLLRRHLSPSSRGKTPWIRAAAAYGLGFCSDVSAAVEYLEGALKDKSVMVSQQAVVAMGMLGGAEAVTALCRIALDGTMNVAVRSMALRVLGRVGDEKSVLVMKKCLGSSSVDVRVAALLGLGEMGTGRSDIRRMCSDDSHTVRAAAFYVLARTWGVDESCFKEVLEGKASFDEKRAVLMGLGESRDPSAAGMLFDFASDPSNDERLRRYAVRSLAMLTGGKGRMMLRRLVELPKGKGRMTVLPLRFLWLGDVDSTVDYLARWVFEGTRHEQIAAIERLGELGTPRAVDILASGAPVFDNHTRWTHIWYLIINAHRDEVRKELVRLLRTHRRAVVRMNAALALAGRRDPAVVDALMEACFDKDPRVRAAAACALGECGDPVAADVLARVAEKDEVPFVYHAAVRAMRRVDYAKLPVVASTLERLKGTPRDCGIPPVFKGWGQPDDSWMLRAYARAIDDLSLPNLSYETGVVGIPDKGWMLQWGAHGRRADSPQTDMTWLLDTATMQWRRLLTAQSPPGTCLNRGLIYSPMQGLVVSPKHAHGGHGWLDGVRMHATWSVPWVFDVAKKSWYPMRPLRCFGSLFHVASIYDPLNDVFMLPSSRTLVYDLWTNRWFKMAPAGGDLPPFSRGALPAAYDPVEDRYLLVDGQDDAGRACLWEYRLRDNRWKRLYAKEPPPPVTLGTMEYDSRNDVMLVFAPAEEAVQVYVYHPRENRWERPRRRFPSPCYKEFDTEYDARHNVVFMTGGWEWGQSGMVPVRETWTYRYRSGGAVADKLHRVCIRLRRTVAKDGVVLEWSLPSEVASRASAVEVLAAETTVPWRAEWKKVSSLPVGSRSFRVPSKSVKGRSVYFRLRVVTGNNRHLLSNVVSTRPALVRDVNAARGRDGAVELVWCAPRDDGIVGYNVYRVEVSSFDPLVRFFKPDKDLKGDFIQVNGSPVTKTTFVDRVPAGKPLQGEWTYGKVYAYVVRSVNVLGMESGPSPVVVSVPYTTGPVVVVRAEDGSKIVLSPGSTLSFVKGYVAYRQDRYKGDETYPILPVPMPGGVFVDRPAVLGGDRQEYRVVAVDGMGQYGIPSPPAWSKRRP